MDNQNKDKAHGREELKRFFKNGGLPSQQQFSYLIESMVNKEDDGFSKDEVNGLHLSASGASKRLITFYTGLDQMQPMFYIDKSHQQLRGLQLHYAADTEEEQPEINSFFLHEGGRMGIGKQAGMTFKLDVAGSVGMQERRGTFTQQPGPCIVPADGNWHDILTHLNHCQAFEVVARTGLKGSGRFAILHAIALSTYGRSHSRIRKTSAHYGFFWNKLNLRWKGKTNDYSLQLRSNSNFGPGADIHYSMTRLWNDEEVMHD